MSVVKETLYTVKCDNCQKQYQSDDFGFWLDKNDALECAQEDGWTKEKNKHYCSKCHHYNNEDELIIKNKEYDEMIANGEIQET